jgi:predicted flavoprotein YhiN
LRDTIERDGAALPLLDLRPDLTADMVRQRVAEPRRAQSLSTFLRKSVGLTAVAVALIRECVGTPDDLVAAIKALPVRLTGTTGLDRAISTAGGLRMDALQGWSVQEGVFVAGEMLDWEAPTGGYLLQASLSTGYAAGEAALGWIRNERTGIQAVALQQHPE